MLNQVVLVGRLARIENLQSSEGKEQLHMVIACPRAFKNAEGEYDTDFISVYATGMIAENTMEYCKKGDVIGVKGRLQSLTESDNPSVVAEKITFLSSKRADEDDK